MKEEWLMSGAVVPVDAETTAALVAEIKRLIDVVGAVMLDQTSHDTKREWVGLTKAEAKEISLANRPYVIDMIAALEARLKEKNGG